MLIRPRLQVFDKLVDCLAVDEESPLFLTFSDDLTRPDELVLAQIVMVLLYVDGVAIELMQFSHSQTAGKKQGEHYLIPQDINAIHQNGENRFLDRIAFIVVEPSDFDSVGWIAEFRIRRCAKEFEVATNCDEAPSASHAAKALFARPCVRSPATRSQRTTEESSPRSFRE